MRLVTFAIALSLVVPACVANTGSPGSDTRAGVHRYCAKSECDQANDECRSAQDSRCSSCFHTCSGMSDYMSDCVATCDDICSSSGCSGTCPSDSPCVETGYAVILPSSVNQDVLAACQRDIAHLVDCNAGGTNLDCDAASRAMVPGTAAGFNCEAQLACDDTTTPCGVETPTSTLGEDMCSACNDDGHCTADEEAFLDNVDAALVPSMRRALESCHAEASCTDAWACVDSFLRTLYPG